MVERHLAKVNVASSNLVFRSNKIRTKDALFASSFVIRRHSQVVRQRSAKPLFPGSNPSGASNLTKDAASARRLFLFVCGYAPIMCAAYYFGTGKSL